MTLVKSAIFSSLNNITKNDHTSHTLTFPDSVPIATNPPFFEQAIAVALSDSGIVASWLFLLRLYTFNVALSLCAAKTWVGLTARQFVGQDDFLNVVILEYECKSWMLMIASAEEEPPSEGGWLTAQTTNSDSIIAM